MSQPDFESVSPVPSVITKKPQWTIYTVLLLIALVSLLLACLFLGLELRAYDFEAKGLVGVTGRPHLGLPTTAWT